MGTRQSGEAAAEPGGETGWQPNKKVRVKCGLPHWAVMQQGLNKKTLEIYFRGDICEIHAADFLNFAAEKTAKKWYAHGGCLPVFIKLEKSL